MVELQKNIQKICVISSVNSMKLKTLTPKKASVTLLGPSFIPSLELEL
jgi:hypothetical protein